MPWLFLLASTLGLLLTLNGFLPVRASRALLVQSFFAGWLTTEAPLHHLAAQLAMAGACVVYGGLRGAPGYVALAVTALSCAGLWRHYQDGRAARHVLERALVAGVGPAYRATLRAGVEVDVALPPGRLLVPVWLTDGRVRRIKHIPYAEGGRRRTLDIYLPRGDVANAPVLFQIHGGGWSIGHKAQQARPLIHYMAARGWVVVSINYRLSPRAKWPAHLVDAKLALAWVKRHIAEYGGDPEFVVCTGGSAGGHLTAMIGLTPGDPRFQDDATADTSVRAAIPFYAPYDFCDREGQQRNVALRSLLERYVVGQPLAQARALFESGSPLGHVHADAPPFFVIHGSHDSLACVEEARLFVSRLRAVSRAPVAYAELPGAQHAFEVFHSPRALHAIRAVHRFAEAVYAQHLANAGAHSDSYIRELGGAVRERVG